MKTMIKLTLLTMMLGIGSQAAIANALQEKIQARKDIVAYGKKFECKDFVIAANAGDLLLIDAFIKAGINKECVYAASHDEIMTEPERSHPWSDNALSAAVSNSKFDVAQMLLNYGVPFEQERERWMYTGNTFSGGHFRCDFEAIESYPRPTLVGLAYTQSFKSDKDVKKLKWAVKHGADVNATEFLSSQLTCDLRYRVYPFVVSPLTAAMRLEKLGKNRVVKYKNSLAWVEYLLKNGAKLNPPLAPIVKDAIKSHEAWHKGENKKIINYPFDLSILLKGGYANQGAGMFQDIAAVHYRIKLAKLLIKHQNATTNKSNYNKVTKVMNASWKQDKKHERFPDASRKALLELNKIVRSRVM